MNLSPLVAFDLIDNERADSCLQTWGHWLGGCNRPFGRQSFGLFVENELISVAVGALRHKGDIYRFDGWKKIAEVKGGKAGGGWQRGKVYEAKSIWAYPLNNIEIIPETP